MAFLMMSSFDIFGTADMTDYFVSVGSGAIVPGAGRCNTAAWTGFSAVGSGPQAGVNATTLSGYAGYAYFPTGFTTLGSFTVLRGDGTPLCFLRHEPNGSISGWKGFNTILGGVVCQTPAGLVPTGHYSHIGAEWLISTSGYLRIYVNGHLAADSGTVNMTTFFTSGQWSILSWTPTGFIDDLYGGDTAVLATNPWAAFLGDLHIEGQLCLTDAVGGGGTFREFTPSAGTDHGALLDENPPNDDTDYVESLTVNQRETVKFPSIIPGSGTIYAYQAMPNGLKTTFSGRDVANLIYSGGTLDVGTTLGLAQTNYRYYPQVYGYNPVTGAPWSIAQVNAAENGVKVIA